MTITLAIPAEIVGDNDTLLHRMDELDLEITSMGRCAGRAHAAGRDWEVRILLDDLADAVAKRDAVRDEWMRRRTARCIAGPLA